MTEDYVDLYTSAAKPGQRPRVHAADAAMLAINRYVTLCQYEFRAVPPHHTQGPSSEINCDSCRSRMRRPDPTQPAPQCAAIARGTGQRCRQSAVYDGEFCDTHAVTAGRVLCGVDGCSSMAAHGRARCQSPPECDQHWRERLDAERRVRAAQEEARQQAAQQPREPAQHRRPRPQQTIRPPDDDDPSVRELDRSRRIGWARAYEAERVLYEVAALLVDGHDPMSVAEWIATDRVARNGTPRPSDDAAALIAWMVAERSR